MRLQKAITLNFNNTQSTTALVQVPFQVGKFHVHNIAYNNEKVTGSNRHQYGVLSSNMGNVNQPLGIFYNDRSQPISTHSDNSFTFSSPVNINSFYSFDLSIPTWDGGDDEVLLLIEFTSADEVFE